MSRHVGILTFHHADNYGAVLQAYALAEAVRGLGHTVEFIDYRPEAARKLYRRLRLRSGQCLSKIARRWKFHHFRRQFLPLSPRRYLTPDALADHPPDVDCIVCGSDQVWNVASYRGFDPAFFLSFARNLPVRKSSYAATFGGAREFAAHRGQIAELLRGFDQISVRDADSQRTVHELIGRTPPRVMDPSFLTDFGPLTPPPLPSGPYISVYAMERSLPLERVVATVSKKLELPAISIAAPLGGTQMFAAPGPQDWLSLVRHARFLVTNSFHGLCFAIIHRLDFCVVPRTRDQMRLDDLLAWLGLSDRIAVDEASAERLARRHFADECTGLGERLQQSVDQSRRFLQEAIHG